MGFLLVLDVLVLLLFPFSLFLFPSSLPFIAYYVNHLARLQSHTCTDINIAKGHHTYQYTAIHKALSSRLLYLGDHRIRTRGL